MNTIGQVAFYKKDSIERHLVEDAVEALKGYGKFQLFLTFIDSRTDCLVQDYLTFYPKPHADYDGPGFIAEHKGLTLRVPEDMMWYAMNNRTGPKAVPQKTFIIVEG